MTDTGWDTIRLQQSGDVVNLDLGTDIGSVRVASRDDGTIMVTSDALSAWVGHIVPNTNNGYQELHIVGTNGILDVRQKIG
ncbi:MAG TPA: hypothetical protein PK765_05610 [bacterium]|nr:hypothetical protein [bacterium]